jgi:prepilin-type N-terminal cleavage/methylation domain-containing protein
MMKQRSTAFTLIELLVTLAIIGLLSAILFPSLARVRESGRDAVCRSNLRQMFTAYRLYLDDHNGRFFPWQERVPDGTLWYWGLEEEGGGSEGNRGLDKSRARLAPYYGEAGGVEICPSLPYKTSFFKQKFELASAGYGLNIYLIEGTPQNHAAGISSFDQIRRPSETIAWGDSIQINTWQAPASPKNPMLEEWYYLSAGQPASFHFRHTKHCNAVMADGSIPSFKPAWLDSRCDGQAGFIELPGHDDHLNPVQ